MIYPKNFEQKTGFDKIRQLIKNECLSTLGKERVQEMAFSASFEKISQALAETAEFKELIVYEDDFPLNHYYDVRPALKKIQVEGMFLATEELFDLKRSLETLKAIALFFKKKREDEKYPVLCEMSQQLQLYPFISEQIDRVMGKTGKIKDNASPGLARIRRERAEKSAGISKKMQKTLTHAQKEGWVESDVALTMRDGKLLIPVPAAYKRKIKGFVHDESASGKTSFIEPFDVVETNNEIRELEFAERREIIKILTELSDSIRPYIEEMMLAYEFLGHIDFLRAKARFALTVQGIKPKFSPKRQIDFRTARHPLLMLSLKKEGKKMIPLDIEINEKQRIVLISGPNAGGKSVCLKTVGILQYMLQCGLLIPVNETSKTGIFQQIFIDIGDEQSLENDLSTYSSHLHNLKHFVTHGNAGTLLLIDEFGTGTEPLLGGAIAETMLENLNEKQVCGVITTHYGNLKHFASGAEGIVNGAMLYDSENMRPLFQLEIGQPGSSFAFEIAAEIGLPKKLLEKASEKIGQEHIDFEKELRKIETERRQMEHLKSEVERKEKQLETAIEKYHKETEFALRERKNILSLTREQAEDILATVNKKIENTIFEIKKTQADKEKTKQAREKFQNFKEDFLSKQKAEEEKVRAKMEKIKEKQARKQKNKPETKPQAPEPEPEIPDPTIRQGDKVKLRGQDTVGEVIEINDEQAMVSFGQMRTIIGTDKLEKISQNQARQMERQPQTKKNEWSYKKSNVKFKSDLDIRGKRVDEALDILQTRIDEAIVVQAHHLRILHGTGSGALRQAVRDFLASSDVVKSFRDEKVQLGGAGITLVDFEY